MLDNGFGIEDDILLYIFNVGFLIKFNEDIGVMLIGIGLCYVKNLIEDLGGSIIVESKLNKSIKFIVNVLILNL